MGKKTGRWYYYFESGILREDSMWRSGQRSGVSQTYYKNGIRKTWINYHSGEMHGEAFRWDNRGRIIRTTQFAGGEKHGAEHSYYWGAPSGKFEKLYSKGQEIILSHTFGYWSMGKKNGVWTKEWSAHSTIGRTFESVFVNGVRVDG